MEQKLTPSLNRRQFLGAFGGVTAAGLAGGVAGFPSPLPAKQRLDPEACEIGPVSGEKRRDQAFHVRREAAKLEKELPLPDHPCNGDEKLYPNKIASYSKGLPHDALGEVDLDSYKALVSALTTGTPSAFERIPLGGGRRLVNPQASLAFDLEGPDSHHLAQIPAPAFHSAEEAGEIAENYWQALTRDVHFSDYQKSALTQAAADDLSNLSEFHGPKDDGRVTPNTLFRGNTPGDLVGPYVSQFLFRDVPYGAQTLIQSYRTGSAGVNYMVTYADWLGSQNGGPIPPMQFDPMSRFIRNGRDLGEYVHRDFPYQAYLNACLILLGIPGTEDERNPYTGSLTQVGQITFGRAHVLDLVAKAANCAFKAAWFQKWSVHRRLRPEAFSGRIHNHLTGVATYPIHKEILDSPVLKEVFSHTGTYLLPQAFPEGSPTHPAYAGGHATIAGACATVLKAFFKESFVLPNPVVASADGLSLIPFTGAELTVGGELNKLAANIGIGRNIAGIHWRSDAIESLTLGEAVAIGVLTEMRLTYNEEFDGFSLTKFDGEQITV